MVFAHDSLFLPGVPADHVLDRLERAGGNEVKSGKLSSPESSAALAVNTFGWFVERPHLLPPLPGLDGGWPPTVVEVEYCARFPWAGGRHPWLDAFIETPTHIVGVESKRFEPYRDKKKVTLSEAYNRPVWGDAMGEWEAMRDRLRGGETFIHLDAVQLVKHAFGLVTEAGRKRKPAVLLYLYAEPQQWKKPIDPGTFSRHRSEIAQFDAMVAGAAVSFAACSYREWLAGWGAGSDLQEHKREITEKFAP